MKLNEFIKYININKFYSYKDVLKYINSVLPNEKFYGKTNKIYIILENKELLLLIRGYNYHGEWKFKEFNKKYLKYDLSNYIKHLHRIERISFKDKHFCKNGHTKKITNYYTRYIYDKKRKYYAAIDELIKKDLETIRAVNWL